jgi:hypothetical protein
MEFFSLGSSSTATLRFFFFWSHSLTSFRVRQVKLRLKVAKEILDTEATYVNSLNILVSVLSLFSLRVRYSWTLPCKRFVYYAPFRCAALTNSPLCLP